MVANCQCKGLQRKIISGLGVVGLFSEILSYLILSLYEDESIACNSPNIHSKRSKIHNVELAFLLTNIPWMDRRASEKGT